MNHSKIVKARASLIIDQPFFASILLTMPLHENPDIPTIATDGESISFNPAWCESLTLSEITFVLAHETLHCVFDHMGRRGVRTPNRWNQAADYVINQLLIEQNVGSMPHLGLYNPKLYADGGQTAEGIYKLLPESNEQKQTGQKGGALDQVHDAGTNQGTSPTDAAKLAEKSADLKVRVIAAKNAAKMQGKLSAGLERLIDEMVKPKIDWKDVLRRFVSERARVDFTFARPKRRFLAEDMYLPSLTGNKMGKLVVAVDCSGSVDQKLLAEFAAEINAIREDCKPNGLDVVYFDSKVCKVESVRDDETLVIKPVGGGGTDFAPVIKHINNMEEEPACVVFLTDLECDSFSKKPSYPVLWCVINGRVSRSVPYGEIVEVASED